MRYALLLYGAESEGYTPEAMPPESAGAWTRFEAEARDAGVLVGWHALAPTERARRVRIDEGTAMVTDGPFAETREQLGGLYVLDCASMDEALAWASRMPCAPDGHVDVRPVIADGVEPPEAP